MKQVHQTWASRGGVGAPDRPAVRVRECTILQVRVSYYRTGDKKFHCNEPLKFIGPLLLLHIKHSESVVRQTCKLKYTQDSVNVTPMELLQKTILYVIP